MDIEIEKVIKEAKKEILKNGIIEGLYALEYLHRHLAEYAQYQSSEANDILTCTISDLKYQLEVLNKEIK